MLCRWVNHVLLPNDFKSNTHSKSMRRYASVYYQQVARDTGTPCSPASQRWRTYSWDHDVRLDPISRWRKDSSRLDVDGDSPIQIRPRGFFHYEVNHPICAQILLHLRTFHHQCWFSKSSLCSQQPSATSPDVHAHCTCQVRFEEIARTEAQRRSCLFGLSATLSLNKIVISNKLILLFSPNKSAPFTSL